jgi:hypothetical protein
MTNPGPKRIIPILAVAGVFLLSACHSDSNESDIKPIRAGVSTPNPAPSGPAVYLRVAASDNPDDNVVPIEVVLNPGVAPITFDNFSIEILPTDPANPGLLRDGIVQFVFDTGAGTTPFGKCNSCFATGGCGGAPVCMACGSCPMADPATSSVNSPLCFAATTGTHSFLATAASVGSSGCLPPSASSEVVLATLTLFAQTTGSARLRFVDNPANGGDCAILLGSAILPVTFDDRGAIFTAGR